MFLKNPKLLWKSNSFRIISIYALIFILSSLIINIYVYKIITNYILIQSRQEIAEDLEEYLQLYQKNGLTSLISDIKEDSTDTYFVRLLETNGKVLTTNFPSNFQDLMNDAVDEDNGRHENEWIFLSGISGYPEFEYITYPIDKSLELQFGQNIKKREDLLASIRDAYGFFILPVVFLAYIGGIYLADRALNPILQVIKTLNSIVDSSNLNLRVPVQEGDELNKELVILFNNMLDKIQILMNGMKEILDNVGHDLRTPLTRLRGMAETALDSSPDVDALSEALSDCVEESENILVMLKSLMDVSEAETGVMNLNIEKFNISLLIDDMVELYSYLAEEKSISVDKKVPKTLFVKADYSRIRQVIANLLDNAIKYTPTGGKIAVQATAKENEVKITFRDSGIGISDQDIDNIWKRLYRGDSSRSQEGHGLGLSLVKAVINAHKGHVEVISKPGVGSDFSIYIPKF